MLCESKDALNCNIFKCEFVKFTSEMMKKAFYFTLKALFVIKILEVLSWLFGNVEKRLDYKAKVNFKIYQFIIVTTNYKAYTIKSKISIQRL